MKFGRTFVLSSLAAFSLAAAQARAGSFTSEVLNQIDDVEKKILSLEEAVPQDKFGWRPGEGVRSVSEVYLHIAGSNYLMMSFVGFKAPEESKWTAGSKDWESQTADRAKIQEILKKSFDYLRASVAKMADTDLNEQVDFFGSKSSKMGVLFSAITHLHEHLGQSIAYARTNGVVPPWTAARQNKK